ncbi:hypothetical protein BJ878DRAFT_83423 [Calycina marina]|uniref:Uncharacterized protein n=1 Tax=Calycina marina TaxID=1763456 RepID=A0A9P8CIN9_9HELO|nr:hypothetical protein BJ878DRAFT_83423 [Calycina marina]
MAIRSLETQQFEPAVLVSSQPDCIISNAKFDEFPKSAMLALPIRLNLSSQFRSLPCEASIADGKYHVDVLGNQLGKFLTQSADVMLCGRTDTKIAPVHMELPIWPLLSHITTSETSTYNDHAHESDTMGRSESFIPEHFIQPDLSDIAKTRIDDSFRAHQTPQQFELDWRLRKFKNNRSLQQGCHKSHEQYALRTIYLSRQEYGDYFTYESTFP